MKAANGMLTAEEILNFISSVSMENGVQATFARIYVDGDRSEYKITEITYDKIENKFHLKIEEAG